MTDAVIDCQGCSKAFGNKHAITDISLKVQKGEIFAIIGPSGAGKTTLLRVLTTLEPPDKGRVRFLGMNAYSDNGSDQKIRRSLGYVPQKATMLAGTVEDNIALPLKTRGVPSTEVRKRVDEIAERFGILEILRKNASKVSGGEAQRTSFARALVFEPKVLFLVEFIANLDPANAEILESVVRDFTSKGGTAVMVTHKLLQVKRLADRMAIVMEGRLVQVGKIKDVFAKPKNELVRKFVTGEMAW